MVCSKGLYPIKTFPQVLGAEASGVIVALPTDEKVLNDEWYKRRGFKIGTRVAFVRKWALISIYSIADHAQYGLGAHAEYVSSRWDMVFPIPDNLSFDVAAAAALQGTFHRSLCFTRPF